uniref:Putative GMC oxidoreductase n=1 Tax=Phaedon cochleariae TaxID=80249 RepID=W4VSN2_PHACE
MFNFLTILPLLLFCTARVSSLQNDSFEDFYNYVKSNLEYANRYVLPNNNRELLETSEGTIHVLGSYDFIIVGGGSAGTVLASRLSEIKKWKILLLEAGGDENSFSDIPGFGPNLRTMNWGYYTTSQKTCCLGMQNQQCQYPRGKVLGGSSGINAMMYVRGSYADFDEWQALGNSGWSYQDVLPYFKKSEHIDISGYDVGYHGVGGPLHVNYTVTPSIIADPFIEACRQKGLEEVDYNGRNQMGVSKIQFNINFNKRSSGSRAFIDPIKVSRKNLHIKLNAFVVKILVKHKVAYGVEYIQGGKRYIVKAKKEVILSAGSINSPQLLLISGLGPLKVLSKLGIRVKNDLPAVGKHLKDHPYYINLFFRSNLTATESTLRENLHRYLMGETPLTRYYGLELIAFINTKNITQSPPDIEYILTPPPLDLPPHVYHTNNDYARVFQEYNTTTDFWTGVILLTPKSEGSVTLRTNSMLEFPLIDVKYFSDPEGRDIETMYQGIKFFLSFTETPAFKKINATLISTHPGCEELRKSPLDRDYWYCAIRHATSTIYHPVGTTRMGRSFEDSVVNDECVVHNMKKLRVVDAGVLPNIVRGHTNAVTYMIAEKISDVIKIHYGVK